MIENIITGVVLTSICVMGIVGNSVTLLVLNSNHQMRNQPINLYLTVLALFDNGVLFNAILMLGIPGIYKLMHDQPPHSFPEDDSDLSFSSEDTFSPSPVSRRSVRLQRELSEILAAIPATLNSSSSKSQLTMSSSPALIDSSLPPSLESSQSLAASVFAHPAPAAVSQATLRTSNTPVWQAASAANYAPVSPERSSFSPSSSASSRVSLSSPSVPLLRFSSLQSSPSNPAPLTTRQGSGKRRRRRSNTQGNGSSRIFNSQPPFSSSVITSSSNQNAAGISRTHAESNQTEDSFLMSPTSSSYTGNSASDGFASNSLESSATQKDHSKSEVMSPVNQTSLKEWHILSDLFNTWNSFEFGPNRSAGRYPSFSDSDQKRPSAAWMTLSIQDQKARDSLLQHNPLSVPEASTIRHEKQQQGVDQQGASGRKEDVGMSKSGLIEEAGLFAGDELIFAPTEDEMDLMASNSSVVSEGPLYLYIQFVYPLALISQTGSIWTTCLITAERYFAIAHPLRALTLSTRKRATWALISMSILAVVYNLPRFAEVEIVGVTEDAPVKNIIRPSELRNNIVYYSVYYICIHLAVLYIIPLTLLSVLNTKIYLAIKRANRDRSSLTQNQESEMNIATMLVFLVAIFIACNLPAFVVNCLELVNNSAYFHVAMIFSNFLVCFNSSVNFVIYCTFGKKFRERLHETFCCSSGRLPRRSTPIRNRKTSIIAETLV